LPVFAEKGRSFIYRNPVNEPARTTLPGHSSIWQIAGHKPVMYMSKRVNQAAYAGINTSKDGKSILHGSEDANSSVLRQFRTG
jgi:hypothetical protein